jgi:hypothetical protein
MSLPAIKWGDVFRYFSSRGNKYIIYHQGGDIIILQKSDKKTVRIGHNFLSHTKTLRPAHLSKIKRTFGISREDILKS